jgi:hypothetical protein
MQAQTTHSQLCTCGMQAAAAMTIDHPQAGENMQELYNVDL